MLVADGDILAIDGGPLVIVVGVLALGRVAEVPKAVSSETARYNRPAMAENLKGALGAPAHLHRGEQVVR